MSLSPIEVDAVLDVCLGTELAAEPTLSEALAARGYLNRAASHGAHDIVRTSDGVVVTTLRASAAWEFVHAFDRRLAKARGAQ